MVVLVMYEPQEGCGQMSECFRALTEVDEEASVALALVLWKNHDA